MADTEKLVFQTDDGKEVEFEIIESTRVNGADYILVTTDDTTIYDSENDDDDSEAVFILKDTAAAESEEALYEFVDDEEELDAVFKIFEQLLDDEEQKKSVIFGGVFLKTDTTEKVKIIPLGGLEQIGMNMTAFMYGDSIIVVDCGLSFPDDDMLGIDLVIPDVTFLKVYIDFVQ